MKYKQSSYQFIITRKRCKEFVARSAALDTMAVAYPRRVGYCTITVSTADVLTEFASVSADRRT